MTHLTTSPAPALVSPLAIVLHDDLTSRMTEAEFWKFCQQNRHLHIERAADQSILIMSPTGYLPGFRSGEPFRQLANWAIDRPGMACDSSTGFTLPDGSVRSPDAAWVSPERDATVQGADRERFAHVCPDFVIEVVSPSDAVAALQEKMGFWLANGVRLGFLIDPATETAWLYHPGAPAEEINGFDAVLPGGEVLPGFGLELWRLRR